MKRYYKLLVLLLCLAPACAWAQTFHSNLHVQSCTDGRSWNAQALVQNVLLGQGVTVSNVKFNNSTGTINCGAIGTFYTTQDSATTNIGLREGILITTGNINGAPGPNTSPRHTTSYTCNSYPDNSLIPLIGVDNAVLYNCSVLEFDFIPQSDSVGFRYVFASEEYPENIEDDFNDIFAFFITGPNPAGGSYTNTNIAKIPGTNLPVSIHNINNQTNSQYYVNNYSQLDRTRLHLEYDGFTTVLTASAQVVPCSTYHLRICLSGVNDEQYDSGVFLEAGSLETKSIRAEVRNLQNPGNPNRINEGCCADLIIRLLNPNSARRTLRIFSNNVSTTNADYEVTPSVSSNSNNPSTFTFPEGQDSLVFHICGTIDDISEALENFRMYYQLQGDCDYKNELFQIANVSRLNLTVTAPESSGSTTTITATTSGGVPPYTYTWTDLRTGQVTTSATNTKVVNMSPLRQYEVCVTDACGNTDCRTCAVGPTPIFMDTAAAYITVCYGTPATLTAPSGATTYRWYNGTNTNSSSYGTGTSYTTPNITYTRIFTMVGFHDTLGMTWRNYKQFTVTYEALPTLGLSYNGSTLTATNPTINVCNGQQVTLNGSGGSQYRWGSGAAFSGSSHTFLPNQATSTASYANTTLQVTAQGPAPRHCLSSPRTVYVHAYKYPTLTPVPDTGICTGNSITLRARPQSASGVVYWYSQPNGTTSGTSSTGRWTGITPTASQDYYVHASTGPSSNNKLCQVHDTVHVTVWPLPTLTTTATPQQACSGEQVTLAAQGASTYTWKKGTASAGSGASITVTNTNSSTTATSGTTVTYTVTGTDAHQCVNTKSQTVVVHNIPTPTLAAAPNPLCVGSSVTLTARGAMHLSWDSLSWMNQTTTTSRTTSRTLNQTGSNTLSVWGYSTLARCNRRVNTSVNVMPYPVVSVTSDNDSVCAGESTILRLSGAAEYSLGDTLHFNTSTTRTVTPTGTGTTYVIYGRNAQHICISSCTIRVGVLQLPSVSLSTSATDLCQGQSATLTATGGSSYNWFVGSSSTPLSQHDGTLTITPTANTSYTVEGITAGDSPCSSRRTVNINVFNYPTLNNVPDTSVCTGNTFNLRARPRTATGVTYWYTLAGSSARQGQGTQGYWSGLSTATDTCYLVYASTGPGQLCQRHDSVRVHLWPLPTVTASAQPQDACSGESFQLIAGGASTYRWQLNNAFVSSAQNATTSQTNSNVAPRQVTYTLLGTDQHGCQNSTTQNVTIHSLPTLTTLASPNPLCTGATVTLTASNAQHLSWDSTQWGGASITATHQLDTARTEHFPVWGYNSLQRCNSKADIPVNVLPYPVFTLSADDDSVCAGESTIIRATGNAYEYSLGDTLHFSTAAAFTVTPTGTGTTYTIYGRNAQHMCTSSQTIRVGVLPLPTLGLAASDTVICQGDTVLLTASNSQAYHWRLQGSSQLIDADSGATRYVSPASTTTYEVEGSNTEGTVRCSSVRLVTVTVFQRPTLSVMADTSICQFKSLSLHASASSATPAVSYAYWGSGQHGSQVRNTSSSQVSWTLQTGTSGTHTFAVSASTGPDSLCRVVDTVHVTIWQLPSVTLQPDVRELCQADTVTLQAGGAVRYSWTTSTGSYQPAATHQLVPTVGVHTYTVYGEDVHGCRNSDTTRVTVYDYPSTQLVSNSYDICHGGSVTLTATGAQHYSWNGGSSWVNATNGMAVSHPVLTDSATLYVEGYNSSQLCQRRDSVRVRVYSYPAVDLTADTDGICLHDTVRLSASGAYQYSWDNGSHWGNVQQMTYVPTTAQTHIYTLIGRSEGPGCRDTVQLPVQVHPLPNLQMSLSNDAFCIDTVIDINATGGYLYRLYSDTATQLPPYSTTHTWQRMPDSSTIYTVDCLTQYNCFATTSHAVTVWTGRFQLFCEDTVVCEHGTVAVSAQGMSEYYWNGSSVPDTHNVYIFTVDSSSDFTVYGRDAHGCHGQETMHVDVYPNPHLQLAADTLGVCVGGTVNILASGAGDYIYHWASPDSTADSSHEAQVFDTTYFVVTGIEGNLRCSSTDSIQIIAYPLPPVSLTPDKRDICDGDTVHLAAAGASRYAWNDSSSYFAVATRSDRPVRDTMFTIWGEEDTYHCRNYDTAIVHWFGHPALSIQSDKYNICEGDSVLLTYSGAPYYTWEDQGTASSLGHRRVKPDTTTTYQLHGDLRNPLFCGSDTSVTIHVYPIPEVRVHAADTELCYGDTLRLTGSGAAYYAWLGDTNHRSADSTSLVLYQSTTLYLSGTIPNRLCYNTDSVSVTVYDPRVRLNPQAWEICNGGTIDVSASGSDRYRWEDNGTFTDSSTHTYAFQSNASISTQHFLHVVGETANHLCQADTTISIVVYPGPNIHLTIEDLDSIGPRTWEVCAGDSVMFLGTGGYFYQFPGQTAASRTVRHRYHPVPLVADTSVYTLYGENFNHQCNGYDSLTIIVNPLPQVQLAASRQEVCVGDSIQLTADGATQYSWWADGQYVTADSLRFVRVDTTTQYLVYGRDPKLCRQFDTITVNAYVVPQVYLTASADTICQGFSTTVTAHGGSRYAWGNDTAFTDSSSCTYTPMHDTVIYVRGCNFNGLCIDGDSLRITVLPVPTVQIEASREVICWDDTVTLTANCSETTWSWNGGAYVSTPLQVWPHDSTMYYISTRAANGCYAYDSILIEVRPFPNVRLHGDEDVCRGDSLLMTATGSSLYAWGSDTSFSTNASRYVRPINDSLIIVRGTARDSFCRSADTILVRVHDRPILYVDPETTTVCLGDSIVLSASGCDQYRWMEDSVYGWHNGYNVYYPQQSMTYIVTGSMQGGVCVVTAPIVMTVIDTPHVQFAGPLHICLGDSVRLTASGGERYAWESATQYVASGYFADLPATLGSHTYWVSSQTHTLNCTGRASVSVQVHPVPVVTLTPDDSVLCYGDYVNLSASGAYHYSWDMGLSYDTASQVTQQPLESTTYTLYGTDSMHLCADTVTQYILVNPLPMVSLTADTTQFCLGESVTLTASGPGTYAWNGGAWGTVTTQTDTPTADTLYLLQGIDSNGCINADSIVVTLHTPFQNYHYDSHHIVVHRYPSVNVVITPVEVCLGDSVHLTAHGADQYRWIDLNNRQGDNVGDVPNADRSYTVVAEMDYGCPDTASAQVHVFRYPAVQLTASDSALCEGSELTLTASGAARYSWTGTDFNLDSVTTLVPPLGENEYVIHGATANLLCEATDTIRMHVYPYPHMQIEGAVRWCEGDEVVLAVNHPADTLRWSAVPADPTLAGQEHSDTIRLHPSLSTTYTVTGTSAICSDTQQHSIVMVPYPELALATTADRLCIGDTITLSATGAELYSWDRLRSYTVEDNHDYRPSATAYIPVTGTTYDTLCSVTDSLFIWVDTIPIMTLTGPDSGCVGRSITLTAHSGVPVTWSAEPRDPDLDNQQGGFEVVVDPSKDTRYIIEGYSGLCYGSAEHQVVTGIIPKAAGTSLPMHVRRAEADIELVNQSISEEGYFWIFPDSTRHFGNYYRYNIPPSYLADTFLVKIVAYRGGCFDTADVPITLSNDEVWTVNAFTPEQETNNRFYVPRYNKENYHLEIFNRRGILVFESDDPEEGWDGRYEGKLCPMAAYVYRVRTSPKNSKEVNYIYGTVTLIR